MNIASAPRHSGLLRASLFALGFASVLTQLTLMRELLSVYAGNELTLGVILGNWLLLTGLGSLGGRTAARLKRPFHFLAAAQAALALLPLAALYVIRVYRYQFWVRGATVDPTQTVLSSFVLLLPYCVISGYLLTLACTRLGQADSASGVGQSYFWDSVGSIAGGVAFSFVLVPWTHHFGILYVPAFLHLLLAAAGAWLLRARLLLAAVLVLGLGLAGTALRLDLDDLTTRREYAGQKVVFRGQSPYGSLVVTEAAGQYNFIENGVPLFSTGDWTALEETVHYPMSQRPDAERVLLLSGGVSGSALEILKYGVRRVDYVELDPLIVATARRFFPESLSDTRIHVIPQDGRRFVKTTSGRYDVVIVDLPDPSTSQLNRFYTAEFFAEARAVLRAGGVLSLGIGHYENYVSDELAALLSVTRRTLSSVFPNVLMIPGGRVFFLASDGVLTLDMAPRMEAKKIKTLLVKRHFLSVILAPDRLADMESAVAGAAQRNSDHNPVLYFHHLLYWISQFQTRFGVMVGVLAVLALIFLWRIRAASFAVFSAGFSASALQVLLMLNFQTLHGSLYHQLGLLTAAFMAGLALGSGWMLRRLSGRRRGELAWLSAGMALLAALLPLMLSGLGLAAAPWALTLSAYVAFPLLILVLAAVEGLFFPLAAQTDFAGPALTGSRLYWADFAGGCLGALLVSTLLIPLLGITLVCLLTAGLNLLSAGVVFRREGSK